MFYRILLDPENELDEIDKKYALVDLYHWILAKHLEHKEAATQNRATRKLVDDAPVNAMEIALCAFFWSFYRVNYRL